MVKMKKSIVSTSENNESGIESKETDGLSQRQIIMFNPLAVLFDVRMSRQGCPLFGRMRPKRGRCLPDVRPC